MSLHLREAVWCVDAALLGIFLLQNLYYAFQLVIAAAELRRYRHASRPDDLWWLLTSNVTVPISLIVPAHNEEATIVDNIHSLLALHYSEFEVIVVNDGSTDGTLEKIIKRLDLQPVERVYEVALPHKPIRGVYGSPRYPRLVVIDKAQGGKADALNAGINLSRHPFFCAVDGDSILDPESLLQVVRPFVEEPEEMIAVGGRIRIVNGCAVRGGQVVGEGLPRHILALFQVIEYTRAFLMARLACSRLNALMIISGAFGVFKRSAVIKVGGYDRDTVGEDMDIVLKLHRFHHEHQIPYKMRYVPDPVCWTEAPASLDALRRQRTRWQRGLAQVLWKHRPMILSPRYGAAGILGLGMHLMFDVIGPIFETIGYVIVPLSWWLGFLSLDFFLAYLMLAFTFGVAISVGSFFLEEVALPHVIRPKHLIILTLTAIAENFGYRQLNNFWRIMGLVQFVRRQGGW